MEKRLKLELELPLDAVYYILLRLPVKSLSRFRCVSKPWCSLISDPHFQKEHSCRSRRSPLILITSGSNEDTRVRFETYNSEGFPLREFYSCKVPPFPVGYPLNHLRFNLAQSCLGLVCFSNMFDLPVHLCNPSTEEIISLPKLCEDYLIMCFGFGYAASTEEYKVARFFVKRPYDEEAVCDIFTVGTNGRWRESRTPPYVPRYNARLPFLHGALHLLPDEDLLEQYDHHYIAVFDLDIEEYRVLPFPEICCRHRSWAYDQLCEMRGSLCLTLASTINKKILEVWLLKDYQGGKWVKQYNIDLSSVSFISVTLLEVVGDDCILLNLVRKKDSELCGYYTRQNRLGNMICMNCDVTFYVESFSSVGSCYLHEELQD